MADYTSIDNPELYFQSVLWTGNGSNPRTITFGGDENMQPDLLWYKCRSHAVPHILLDSVRTAGNDKELQPDDTTAEGGTSAETDGYISAFTSNGFTLAAGSSGGDHYTNEGSRTFVAWGWKESATAGFDIVTYTGNATDDTDISHSLSAVPHVIIIKNRDQGSGYNWRVYHHKNTSAPETDRLNLNDTNATHDDASYWSDEAPTSSVFTLGTDSSLNGNTEGHVAYLWSEKQGFSKFGSYVANANDNGPFVYTGFRPAWIMCKAASDSGEAWAILDNKRNTFNPVLAKLFPNANSAESATAGDNNVDFLSNGFKIITNDNGLNKSGVTFIFAAFAEAPFVNSNGVPCNAR